MSMLEYFQTLRVQLWDVRVNAFQNQMLIIAIMVAIIDIVLEYDLKLFIPHHNGDKQKNLKNKRLNKRKSCYFTRLLPDNFCVESNDIPDRKKTAVY